MESRISNLKTDFNTITLVRSKIINIFELLKNKSDKLKTLYSEFIRNNSSQSFIFGLDSFHFQNKLIDLENDDMKRMFLIINNRMYCEYFKLYKIMVSYINDNISDKKIIEIIKGSNFPIYKDLEPFKDYKFETISDIHENILILLTSIMSIINNKENELSLHQTKRTIGLNIDNFVNSFNFEITIMREKINLFLLYMEFFHKLHNKYLKRFNNKMQNLLNNINSDINFDEDTEENNKEIEYINDQNVKTDNNISITTSDKILNLNIDVIGLNELNENANIGLINFESGTNTPSNSSFASTENSNSQKKKFKVPSIIKNGFKKVNNIINSCNNKNAGDVLDHRNLQLEELLISNKNSLTISLNDFNDNIETIEVNENVKEFTQEIEDIISSVFNNEKEIQTEFESIEVQPSTDVENHIFEESYVVSVEEPVIVETSVVSVEIPIVVTEEPIVVTEEQVIVEEEPVVIVEEQVIVEEEPVVIVEEKVIVEEEPVVVTEEPVVIVEEPIVVTEEPIVVTEEPVVVAEEQVVVAEEPIVVTEEPIVVTEEPVVVAEEPVVTEMEPIIVVEEEPLLDESYVGVAEA